MNVRMLTYLQNMLQCGDTKWVRIRIRDEFKCVYCKEELLKDVIRMNSAQIDHLLQKSRYPKPGRL